MRKKEFLNRTIVLFGCLLTNLFVAKMTDFSQIGKHYLCSEGKKRAFSLTFFDHTKITKRYNNRGFSRHKENPKWHFWGILLSAIHKSCALLKTLFYSVFSKAQVSRNKSVS